MFASRCPAPVDVSFIDASGAARLKIAPVISF
jgi:hypothetical protein